VTDRLLPGLVALLAGAALIAVLFVPFVARTYRRRGELGAGRVLLATATAFYAMGLVAFVVLPLPADTCSTTAASVGPQLQPLAFVADIQRTAAPGVSLLANPAVLQVALNVLLFVPFGALLRHLGGRGVLLTALAGVVVSGLVEFTQLTGDWFLYPCPYRLFDVDDLLANGAGALVGALVAPLLQVLPGERPRRVAVGLPRPVTVRRRVLAVLCDLLGNAVLGLLVVVPLATADVLLGVPGPAEVYRAVALWVPWVLLFVVLPVLGRGGTLGQRAVLLRPCVGGRPHAAMSRSRRLARGLAGTGGIVLLTGLGEAFQPLAGLAVLVSLVGLLVVPDRRGLSGLLTGTALVDAREPDRPTSPTGSAGRGQQPGQLGRPGDHRPVTGVDVDQVDVRGGGELGQVARVDQLPGLGRAEFGAHQHDGHVEAALVGEPDGALGHGLRDGDRRLGDAPPGRLVQVVGIRSGEGLPAGERHGAVGHGEEVGVAAAVDRREAADHDGRRDPLGAGVGGHPGQGARGRVADDQGGFGRGVDRGEHCGHLVVEGGVGGAVALAGQGDRRRAVAERAQFSRDVVPDARVQPQARDQQDVHRCPFHDR
jgi:glycopeptide antibiotics resistance protein